MLPNNSADVIHVETDSIYFNSIHKEQFVDNINNYHLNYDNSEYPIKIGEELGNIKQEVSHTNNSSYFLGKKFYTLCDENGDDHHKIKGIPKHKLNPDGSFEQLVSRDLYKNVFNLNFKAYKNLSPGKDKVLYDINADEINRGILFSYTSLKKNLYGETSITQINATRTINRGYDYMRYYNTTDN
jgi:hypothetical protein